MAGLKDLGVARLDANPNVLALIFELNTGIVGAPIRRFWQK